MREGDIDGEDLRDRNPSKGGDERWKFGWWEGEVRKNEGGLMKGCKNEGGLVTADKNEGGEGDGGWREGWWGDER